MNEAVNAKKTRLGRANALRLARSVSKIVAIKGRAMVTFDMKISPPDDETLLAALLGPTGNLRAPTIRKGDVLLVGFNAAVYAAFLG